MKQKLFFANLLIESFSDKANKGINLDEEILK